LFVIDPLPSLNLKLDSSLRMMAALAQRGHEIHVCEPRQLGWLKSEGPAHAFAQKLSFKGDATQFDAGAPRRTSLADFAAIHMRKDPPYDLEYIATTWLLDSAGPKTKIYNAPQALRGLNEKLAIFLFEEETRDGLVSANPEELYRFAKDKAGGDAIVKPLTLFGGRGVMRLQTKSDDARQWLEAETAHGTQTRLIQAFDPAIFQGEIRVFTAFAEPIAWCLKTPEAGNFLANTRAGATLAPYAPKAAEVARVTSIARKLLAEGVVFIGFDVIGGFVSEINITSPRLLVGPGGEGDQYERIAALVEKDLGR
jgi:glutathione synthase